MTIKDYETVWNALGWEISQAIDSYHGIAAWGDRQEHMISHIRGQQSNIGVRFPGAWHLFSNALYTHFFILLCKIREENNSKSNLKQLFDLAVSLNLLRAEELSTARRLMDSTGSTFKKLKIARGMAVAHLHGTSQTAFSILKSQGIHRADLKAYIEECAELFSILAEPIGKKGLPASSPHTEALKKEMKMIFDIFVHIEERQPKPAS